MIPAERWKKSLRVASAFLVFLAIAFPVVLWTEAEKEIRILCGMLPAGTAEAEVIRTLNTGNLLRYGSVERAGPEPGPLPSNDRVRDGGYSEILVESPWTLGTLECRLSLAEGVVTGSTYRSSFRLATVGAWVATGGFLLLGALQLLLATGAPLGHLAWDGRHRVLPTPRRIASLLSAGFLVLASLALLQKAGIVEVLPWGQVVETLPWVLVLAFLSSLLGNALSERPGKRRFGVFLALLLSLACLAVGLGM